MSNCGGGISNSAGCVDESEGDLRPGDCDDQGSSGSSTADDGNSNKSDNSDSPHLRDPQDPGGQDTHASVGPGNPAETRVMGEESAATPQGEHTPVIPDPSRDAETRVRSRLLEFSVTVPFRSTMEANMARRSLASNAQRQQLMVQQEITVNDCIMTVWATADPLLFRISISGFMDELSSVMRNLLRLEFVKRRRGRRHEP